MVGIGVPIPILDEEMLSYCAVEDKDIEAPLCDYGPEGYPTGEPCVIGMVNYAQLKSGEVEFEGKKIRTAPLSSYSKALDIANQLKQWIQDGKFELGQPSRLIPGANSFDRKEAK